MRYFTEMMSVVNRTVEGDFSILMMDADFYKALGTLLANTDVRYSCRLGPCVWNWNVF